MNDRSPKLTSYYIIFALLAFATLFYGLGSYPILNMNEGLYAEIPREMLLTGNYIIPHLNFVPYIEKPPLLYWFITFSYHLFGISAFAARMVPASSAVFCCSLLIYLGHKLERPRSGLLAAIILTSSIGFILMARILMFDMLLTACFSAALCLFYLWHSKDKIIYLRVAYCFLGLALMTKGFMPVVLFGVIAVLFLFFTKSGWSRLWKLFDPIGLLLFFAIVIPWHIAAMLKQSSFAWDFFVNEQVMRFLNKRVPFDYHTGPIYYYIPRVLVFMLPWSLFLPTLIRRTRTHDPLKIFLWLWFLVPFVFFSISQAKGDYFMIVALPALAYLLALRLEEYFIEAKAQLFARLFAGFVLLEGIALSVVLHFNTIHIPVILTHLLWTSLCVTLALGVLGAIINYKSMHKPLVSFALFATLAIPGTLFFIDSRDLQQEHFSEAKIGGFIRNHDPERPLYMYQHFEEYSSLLFYSKRRIRIVDTVSQDLYYGSHSPAAKGWFISDQRFLQEAKQHPVYIAVRAERLKDFSIMTASQHFCQLLKSDDLLLLSNAPSDCHKA